MLYAVYTLFSRLINIVYVVLSWRQAASSIQGTEELDSHWCLRCHQSISHHPSRARHGLMMQPLAAMKQYQVENPKPQVDKGKGSRPLEPNFVRSHRCFTIGNCTVPRIGFNRKIYKKKMKTQKKKTFELVKSRKSPADFPC